MDFGYMDKATITYVHWNLAKHTDLKVILHFIEFFSYSYKKINQISPLFILLSTICNYLPMTILEEKKQEAKLHYVSVPLQFSK